MKIAGIDTGAKGCICLLDVVEKTASYLKLPYRDDGIINGYLIEKLFEGFNGVNRVVIEKVQGRGGWGATQTFNFGKNYGMVLGLLHHLPLTFVQPAEWQKAIHKGIAGATAKDRSLSVFASLNPSFGQVRKCDEGLVDSFFIARWSLEKSRMVFCDDWNFINMGNLL